MIYEYECGRCNQVFDVVKSHKDMEKPENCPECGTIAVRNFIPQKIHLFGTSVEHPEYNPGLGQVVKNSKHRKELAKRSGLVEMGNVNIESVHKDNDDLRAKKKKESWEKV